jgi:uncharacterized protein (DUF2267 family)
MSGCPLHPAEKQGGKAMSGLEGINHTVQLTHAWINDLDARLAWNNKPRSYRLLKAVLHAVRDWLPVNEAANLGAQLPELLRGAYYEQWHPAATPVKGRTKDDFLARVATLFVRDPLAHPDRDVMEVLRFLTSRITPGEIEDVRRSLPEELRNFWPEPYREPGAVSR